MNTGRLPPSASKPAFWPTGAQYSAAIQNLHASMTDPELREGQAALSPRGLLLVFSGGFANVYQIRCPRTGNTWAVKLFKYGADGLQQRYQAISQHLRQVNLPFLVDFEYLPEGVLIEGRHFPLVKMKWVEGVNLQRFVEQSLDQPRLLDNLLKLWVKVAGRLDAAGIAHGDLQHGNVLLVPKGEQGNLLLTLIDFDGMYVPELSGRPSGEVGLAAYQHPLRTPKNAIYRPEVDRFSHLAICCALRCLREGGRGLWERFSHDEGLLFKGDDFQQPAQSALFRELWTFRHVDARALVGHLALATQGNLEQTPRISELIVDGHVASLTRSQIAQVDALFRRVEPLTLGELCTVEVPFDQIEATAPVAPHAERRVSASDAAPRPESAPTPNVTPPVPAPRTSPSAFPVPASVLPPSPVAQLIARPAEEAETDKPSIADWLRTLVATPRGGVPLWLLSMVVHLFVLIPLILIISMFRTPAPPPSVDEPPAEIVAEKMPSDDSPPSAVEIAAAAGREEAMKALRRVKVSLAQASAPPQLEQAEAMLGEADENLERQDFDAAEKLYRAALATLTRVERDLPAWTELDVLRREWTEQIAAGGPELRGTSDEPVLKTSESRRDLAEADLVRGDYTGAKKQYRVALDMLQTVRARVEENTTLTRLVRELETALERHDSWTAESALSKVEQSGRHKVRLPAWKDQIADLDRRFPTGPPKYSPGERLYSKTLQIKLVLVPAGAMIRTVPTGSRTAKKLPDHVVGISKPFFLGATEVTIRDVLAWLKEVANVDSSWLDTKAAQSTIQRNQGRFVMRGGVSVFGRSDEQPMVFISYAGAEAFCAWLSTKDDRTYRLPTEAEWEYAARAESAKGSNFWNISAPEFAWTEKNAGRRTQRVETKLSNAFGLFDMVGNASEWCRDWHDPTLGQELAQQTLVDPVGPSIGVARVVRGGSWDDSMLGDLMSRRDAIPPTTRNNKVGFRVAVDYASVVANCDDTIEASIGLKLKRISAGEFTMGASSGVADEGPEHRVRISRDFFLGIHEVTQGEYQAVTGLRPSTHSGNDLPVGSVGIEHAKNFCRLLNERERAAGRLPWRMEYRLPTEAQWEYAARAATSMKWVWGALDGGHADHAWTTDNSDRRPQPVGSKQPNAWGLYDLAGNVSELVLDQYDAGCYLKRFQSLAVDPFVAKATRGSAVARGGSFLDSSNECRCASRLECAPTDLLQDAIGFRVALVAVEAP